MNNVLYQRALRPFDAEKDIDSAPHVYVTEENNHFHLWTIDDNNGTKHRGFYWRKEDALEAGVAMAKAGA